MLESFDRVIDAVAGIYRPDGQHAVSLFYMDGEILAAADDNDPAVVNEKKNIRWFLQTHYPAFIQKARAAGIIPSVYFLVNPSESHALQNDYMDSYLPILHQRRSMYWLYRSVKFMQDANLEVPERIDFSMYTYYPYDFSNPATIVNRIFDDLEATLGPLLGTPLRYAIAETPYYEDVSKRRRMAKAIAAERDLRGSNPEFVTFWTTPYGNGLTPPVGYPFDIDVWYGDDLIAPFGGLNPSFEVAATNAQKAEEWVLSWQVGGASGWSVQRKAGGAYEGSYKLRFTAGQCDVCDGNWDGVYARSAKVDVTPGDTVMLRFMEKNSANLEGQVGVPGYSGPVATLIGYTASGQEKVLAQVGMPYGGWKYRRHVMVERIPADVVQVALRFGLVDLWGKIMDVDFIH